ncbi:glycosyltransferase family 39 protein [bacterium]|nr:hypothetical protein [Candidatus Omnitrophota bacterium]MBU3930698.1 glycosyltransferase family 39 protein [bacterium]MBU4122769.1 glycosyltransferase family 39 protein [bacterium]
MVVIDFFCAVFIFLIAVAIGRKIFKWLKWEFNSPAENNLFSLGIGLLVLAYGTYGLGVCGFLYKMVFYPVFLILTFFLFPEIKQIIMEIKNFISEWNYSDLNAESKILIILLLTVAVANFFFSYAPPVGEDGLNHYLFHSMRFVRQHYIAVDLDFDFTQFFPLLIQMLYAIGMLIKGVMVAKLIVYFLGISIACGVYFLTKQLIGKRFSLLAVAVYYTMPQVTGLSGVTRIYFGQVFYTLLTAWALLNYRKNNYARKDFYLAAVMSGAAFSVKYQGLSAIAAGFILIFFWQVFRRRISPDQVAKELIIFFLISFSLWIPWLVRNYFATGSPFYPLYLSKALPFGETAMLLNKLLTASPLQRLIRLLLIPRDLPYGGLINGSGPMLLAFMPLLLFVKNVSREIKILFSFSVLILIVTGAAISISLNGLWLYFAPVYLFFAIITAYAIIRISETQKKTVRVFLYTAVLLALIFPNSVLSYYFGFKRLPFFLGRQTAEEYIQEECPPEMEINFIKFCNKNLPKEATLLNISSLAVQAAPYYQMKIIPAKREQIGLEEPDEILEFLNNKKIDYVVFQKRVYSHNKDGSFTNTAMPFFKFNWFKNKIFMKHFQLMYSEKDKVYLYKLIK